MIQATCLSSGFVVIACEKNAAPARQQSESKPGFRESDSEDLSSRLTRWGVTVNERARNPGFLRATPTDRMSSTCHSTASMSGNVEKPGFLARPKAGFLTAAGVVDASPRNDFESEHGQSTSGNLVLIHPPRLSGCTENRSPPRHVLLIRMGFAYHVRSVADRDGRSVFRSVCSLATTAA